MDDLDKMEGTVIIPSPDPLSSGQRVLPFGIRPKLKLSEVERLIRRHRIITPCPARQTLIGFCEDGTFDTVGTSPTSFGWLVYEDSFWRWARSFDEMAVAA